MYKLIFSPPLRGRIKEGVSASSSPSQGVTQKGFQRVETSPQPSPERRGRRILPSPSGEFLFSFRPSQGRNKGEVSTAIFSPSQGENQRGGFLYSGGQRRGFL